MGAKPKCLFWSGLTTLFVLERSTRYARAIIGASTMATNQSVVLETSMGDIQLELYWDHAPRVRIV